MEKMPAGRVNPTNVWTFPARTGLSPVRGYLDFHLKKLSSFNSNPTTTTARTMVDRISSLPDGIICHILSFLPTHESVSTTVLSKRWYPLWRYVTTLYFDDESVDDEKDDKAYLRFKEFVLSVLLFRDHTQPIKSFTIQHYHSDYTNLNKWVSFVLQRGEVEYLDLDMATDCKFHEFPIGVFNCRTLVVLKLTQFYVRVNDVSSVELPLLKVLHLRKVEFTEYRLLPDLLSGCPNLEDFEAVDVNYHRIISNVHFKMLTKLMRAMILDGDFTFPLEALYNVEYLHLDIPEVSPHYDHIPVFCNLTKVKLFLYNYRWQWLLELLKHCPKLQILIIHEIFMSGPDETWDCPRFVPHCVSLHLRECTIYQFGGMEGELRFARYILQNARVLKTLAIHSTCSSDNRKLLMLQELSLCLRSSATCKLVFK